MSEVFSDVNIGAVSLVLAIAMAAAWMLGRTMGRILHDHGYSEPSKFDDVSMALLGLLVAFSFGMSIQQFDQRETAVLNHTNAMADLYYSAGVLKDPARSRLQALVRQYAQLVLEVTEGPLDDASINRGQAKADEINDQMQDVTRQAIDEGISIPESLNAELNAMRDNQVARLAAYRKSIPASILFLLFVSSVITTFLIGREQGLTNVHDVAGTSSFILLVTIAIYVTLDLNSPNRGFIHINHESLERLVKAISK
jgi:hypothetical protein